MPSFHAVRVIKKKKKKKEEWFTKTEVIPCWCHCAPTEEDIAKKLDFFLSEMHFAQKASNVPKGMASMGAGGGRAGGLKSVPEVAGRNCYCKFSNNNNNNNNKAGALWEAPNKMSGAKRRNLSH